MSERLLVDVMSCFTEVGLRAAFTGRFIVAFMGGFIGGLTAVFTGTGGGLSGALERGAVIGVGLMGSEGGLTTPSRGV